MGESYVYEQLGASVILLLIGVVCLAISAISIASLWKCFVKIGEPGWVALIPFYNSWVLCTHTWGHGAMMFTWMIPYVGSIFTLITYWKLFKGFGKSTVFCILGLFFQPIALAICAFDDSNYDAQLGALR